MNSNFCLKARWGLKIFDVVSAPEFKRVEETEKHCYQVLDAFKKHNKSLQEFRIIFDPKVTLMKQGVLYLDDVVLERKVN